MSVPKRGLGRGLGALLGEAKPITLSGSAPAPSGVMQVRVDAVRPNPRQPRKVFDPEALEELEQSIRELGVLVPIIVRELGAEQYELIAGERRWRAACALRLPAIPAIVREADDRDSLEVAIVENVLREELDPLEEAMGYANLMEEYGYTQERVAERLGKSRPTIANALRLLSLPDAIKGDLRAGRLSAGHARALLAFPPEERIPVASRIIGEELSVREVERLAAEREAPTPARPSRQKPVSNVKSPDLERVESRLRYRFGAHAAIEPGAVGGRIVIRYVDQEDLIRLVDILVPEE